jgi:hypothetical protein
VLPVYGYYRSEYSTVLAGVAIAEVFSPIVLWTDAGASHFLLAKWQHVVVLPTSLESLFPPFLYFFLLGLKHKRNRKWFYTGTVLLSF